MRKRIWGLIFAASRFARTQAATHAPSTLPRSSKSTRNRELRASHNRLRATLPARSEYSFSLSLAKTLSSLNAIEQRHSRKTELRLRRIRDHNVTMFHYAEVRRMVFSVGTGANHDIYV